ncbi:hypothetical protein BJV74DRAFT_321835 [Russula compacta]|nr:hypothetical protein BJV74DRAFT_321835 [Russula compacta]
MTPLVNFGSHIVTWFFLAKTTEYFILYDIDAPRASLGHWYLSDQLHIWVYNQGWVNDSSLWEDIQRASWEDIILEFDFKQVIQKDVLGFLSSKDSYKVLTPPWKATSHLHVSLSPPFDCPVSSADLFSMVHPGMGKLSLSRSSWKTVKRALRITRSQDYMGN